MNDRAVQILLVLSRVFETNLTRVLSRFLRTPTTMLQAHLLEIPQHAGIRSFHINRAECIGADNTITHRTVDGEIVTEKFLTTDADKDVVMGVTSGASTRKWFIIIRTDIDKWNCFLRHPTPSP